MRRAHHYTQINAEVESLSSRVAALANSFKELAPRTEKDEAFIGLFLEDATALAASAQALLTIAYDPTPVEPEAP
jgi:hypothetical protein